MIETLISSKTRIKLLLKFFLNSDNRAHLRGLESEFSESSNAIRLELNRFEQAGMLGSEADGNKKVFFVNRTHPLFDEVQSIVRKFVGIDKIVDHIVSRLGELEEVYLTGSLARGLDADIIDLVFVGDIDRMYLMQLCEKTEKLIRRKIRFAVYSPSDFTPELITEGKALPLLLWSRP